MNTTENNKLIAEFMGINYQPDSKREFINGAWIINKVHYTKSWDWLIPIVEKIESLDYEIITVLIWNKRCSIDIDTYGEKESLFHYAGSSSTKIEAVYNAVVAFIKWYNQQNPKP